MHAISHQLAHCGPSATRARARWQPYHCHPTVVTARSSPSSASLLITSSSSLSTASSSSTTNLIQPSLCRPVESIERTKPFPINTQRSLTHIDAVLAQRTRYATGLIDLAVKALCDVWPMRDIPTIFAIHIPSSKRSVHASGPFVPPIPLQPPSVLQLPSPPNSPDNPPSDSFEDEDKTATSATMRGFVVDVLRRSRTSTSTLQVALCYIEVIRAKIPELRELERSGNGVHGEVDQSQRIVLASDPAAHEIDVDVNLDDFIDASSLAMDPHAVHRHEGADTQPATPCQLWQPAPPGKKPRTDLTALEPMPPLPSPLLDPRRTFIAALVLASKFSQDKCYSNRAWAKLAGLPPREIGRCERALGNALGWRLWVGKKPATQTLSRSQSENVMYAETGAVEAVFGCDRSLRRSSTLPATAFQSASEDVGSRQQPLPAPYLDQLSSGTLPFSATMQGPWMPMPMPSPGSGAPWCEPTPQLSASPTSTDSSVDEQRTVQLADVSDMPGCMMDPKAFVSPPSLDPSAKMSCDVVLDWTGPRIWGGEHGIQEWTTTTYA